MALFRILTKLASCVLAGSGGERPALDACNGHYGTVPANETLGIESTCVYHYHLTDGVPYTLGCYGPVNSVEECKALYLDDGSGDDVSAPMGGGGPMGGDDGGDAGGV